MGPIKGWVYGSGLAKRLVPSSFRLWGGGGVIERLG